MSGSGRRGFLGALGCFGLGLAVGFRLGAPRAFAPGPPQALTGEALELANQAFAGLDRAQVWDAHVHIVGVGAGGTGCYVSPKMMSHLHPVRRFQMEVYMAAAGVTDLSQGDQQYVERLLTLHRLGNPTGQLVAYAFDWVVREDGTEDRDATEMHTPNEYVLSLTKQHPELVYCASIHPYRKDAVERLNRAVEDGARAIKWLPNAQGIDPSSELCRDFYARLAELGLPLITHAGEEQAVHSDQWQEYGNPLRLRRALEAGVKVVIAHCASLGEVNDLDEVDGRRISAFDAFMRLFGEKKWTDHLYADISALTQFSRAGRPLRDMLISKDLHPRLVYGSDYPLPAIDPLTSTRLLQQDGYLVAKDRELLNEIYVHNPLLFDFVLKRRLRYEYKNAVYTFADSVFQTRQLFEPTAEKS